MTRKINYRNVALVSIVSIIDICAGFYDRFMNNSGIIKSVVDAISTTASQPSIIPTAFNESGIIETVNSIGGFGIVIVVIVVILLMAWLVGSFASFGARM